MSLEPPAPTGPVPRFYAAAGLQTECYDALHTSVAGGDDVAFLRDLALETGGPVLELGAGTGRVAIPLAEAGLAVVGLDRSPAMLRIADAKRRALPPVVRRRLRFVEGDMTAFRLGRRFGLVFAAFRVFMSLTEPDAQRSALATIRRHLRPGGLLVLDLFDPRLPYLEPGATMTETIEVRHPETGRRVRREAIERTNDPVDQRVTIRFRFTELDDEDAVVREEDEDLVLRWTYRYELWHLLELAGFERLAEYSDYDRSAPRYAGEIIAVARRPARR